MKDIDQDQGTMPGVQLPPADAKETRHMTRKKNDAPRYTTNPYSQLVEWAAEQGLEQVRVTMKRRGPDGVVRHLKSMALSFDEVARIESWTEGYYGGGKFEAYMYHPADPKQQVLSYAFEIEGPERRPEDPVPGPGQPDPGFHFGNPAFRSWPGTAPPTAPNAPPFLPPPPYPGYGGYGGYGAPSAYGPFYPPMPMYDSQQPQQHSVEEQRLRSENDGLKANIVEINRKLDATAAERQLETLKTGFDRQLEQMRSDQEKTLAALTAKLDGTGGKQQDQMISLFLEHMKSNQAAIADMAKRDVDSNDRQLKYMTLQMDKDLDFRKTMFEMAQKANDPSKYSGVMDQMGNFAANQINLMMQMAQSGLLTQGGGAEPPAWLTAVQTGLESLQKFGTDYFAAKQRDMQLAGMQRPMAPGPLRQLPPPPRPQPAPGAPPQAGPKLPPAPGAKRPDTGFGQPLSNTPVPKVTAPEAAPTPPGEQPDAAPATPPAPVAPDMPIFTPAPGNRPPSLMTPLQDIGHALFTKADPEHVAEMIHMFCDFHRFNHMMPLEFDGIFEKPKDVLTALIQHFAPGAEVDQEYLDEVVAIFVEIEDDLKKQMAADRAAAPDNVVDIKPAEQPPAGGDA